MVGATRTTVCQTVRTLGVVQGDGVSKPTGTPLNDAGHLTACSWFGFAQEEQGVPAGAFMIVRRRFVTAPEFFNAQMGSDLYGFDPYSLAHFRISRVFQAELARIGAQGSMSRKANCWDNGVLESFFSSLRRELLDGTPFESRTVVRQAIFESTLVFYNRR